MSYEMKNAKDPCFNVFSVPVDKYSIPERFTYPFEYTPHPLSILAAEELQNHLQTQTDWEHNFGLVEGQEGKVIGKMFGVLVVKDQHGDLGYLSAFSGKLAGGNHHPGFVPPVFDALTRGSFLNQGMTQLTEMSNHIKSLEASSSEEEEEIERLKAERRDFSIALQDQIFDNYSFLNKYGESKSVREIFEDTVHNQPPSGAGDCAAPKLLQYAFLKSMKPIAFAEFWWGLSPKSYFWEHGHYYPSCDLKCRPILKHMLKGIELEVRSKS